MDIFVEQLVKKKRDAKDFAIMIGGVAAAILIVFLLTLVFNSALGFVMVIAVFALIYGLYYLITSLNLEYEYCFTNGALDVDKIVNLRKRQRMTELNAREIDLMAKRTSPSFEKYMNNSAFKKVYACADKNSDDVYFVIYNENGAQKMLLFSPNEQIKEGFKKFNPQKVEL